jgi:hypothetical protein
MIGLYLWAYVESLTLQPKKTEVTSLISSEREFSSFLWFVCGRCWRDWSIFLWCEILGFSFLGLCQLNLEKGCGTLEKLFFLSGNWHCVCLHLSVCRSLLWSLYILCSCFTRCEVFGVWFVTVCTFRVWVLFWFLAFTREMVSYPFGTFWVWDCEIELYDRSFDTCSTGMGTQSTIVFCVCTEEDESYVHVKTFRGKNREFFYCRFSFNVFRLMNFRMLKPY